MNELIKFEFNGASVRGFVHNGEPLFVASDVARLLGYADADYAVRTHCKRARPASGKYPGEAPGYFPGHGKTLVIDEGDVNRLIAKSRLAEAEKIQDWWYDEVIPTIRKTGKYETKPLSTLDMIIASAQEMKKVEERVAALETKERDSDAILTIKAMRAVANVHPMNALGNFDQNRTYASVRMALAYTNLEVAPEDMAELEHKVNRLAREYEVPRLAAVEPTSDRYEPKIQYPQNWVIQMLMAILGAYRK